MNDDKKPSPEFTFSNGWRAEKATDNVYGNYTSRFYVYDENNKVRLGIGIGKLGNIKELANSKEAPITEKEKISLAIEFMKGTERGAIDNLGIAKFGDELYNIYDLPKDKEIKLDNLYLSKHSLKEISDLSNVIVEGELSLNAEGKSNNYKHEFLSNMPKSAKTIDLSYNKLSSLKDLPQGVENLDIKYNSFRDLSNIPETVKSLDINGNNGLERLVVSENLTSLKCNEELLKDLAINGGFLLHPKSNLEIDKKVARAAKNSWKREFGDRKSKFSELKDRIFGNNKKKEANKEKGYNRSEDNNKYKKENKMFSWFRSSNEKD